MLTSEQRFSLEGEDDSAPLIPTQNEYRGSSNREKFEQGIRLFRRVFNPIIDGTALMNVTSTSFFLASSSSATNLTFLIAAVLGFMVSTTFEIVTSCRLGKKNPFIIGKNRYELAKVLHEKLSREISTEYSEHYFEAWIETLKQSSDSSIHIKKLIREFEIARTYYHTRTLADLFSMFTIYYTFSTLFSKEGSIFPQVTWFRVLATCALLVFTSKIATSIIEFKWYHHEKKWLAIPLPVKRGLLALRYVVDGFHYFFTGVALVSFLGFIPVSLDLPHKSFYTSIPISIIFTVIQLTSASYFTRLQKLVSYLKRGSTSLVQGFTSSVLIVNFIFTLTLIQFSSCMPKCNDEVQTLIKFYSPFLATFGLLTAINVFINYQEPDPQMMSLIVHDVAKAREEIFGSRRDLALLTDDDTDISSVNTERNDDNEDEDIFGLRSRSATDRTNSFQGGSSGLWSRLFGKNEPNRSRRNTYHTVREDETISSFDT